MHERLHISFNEQPLLPLGDYDLFEISVLRQAC